MEKTSCFERKMFEFGFCVCRVCRSPPNTVKLQEVFTGAAGIEGKIQSISNVDVSQIENRAPFRCLISTFPQFSKDKGKHPVLICNHCLQRVNEACRTIKDIIETDEEYFEKLRNDYKENETLAVQEEVEGVVVVKMEISLNQFDDDCVIVEEVKKERVEVKQEVDENSNNPTIWNSRAVLREFESLRKENEAIDVQKSAEEEEASSNEENNETTAEADQQRSKRRRSLTESTKEPPEKRKATEVSTEEERSPEETQENLENVEVDPIAPGEDAESSDHIEKVQKKKKNFTCKRCSTGFRTNGGLKNHLKSRMCYKRIWEILRKKSLAHETSVNTQTIQMP
jgi:hypothetical protein